MATILPPPGQPMEFRCIPDVLPPALEHWQGDCLAMGLFQGTGEGPDETQLERLAAGLGQPLAEPLQRRRFKAKPGESLSFDRPGATPQTLIVVGLGQPADFCLSGLRQACAAASQAAVAAGCRHLALAMPLEALETGAAAQAMAGASRLACYSDQRFKGEAQPANLPETVSLIGVASSFEPALAAMGATCAGVELARQLVAAPPNLATPQHLADTAGAIVRDFGGELKVLERDDCQALGMGAYLGVAQGSDLAPKFIHFTYRPAGSVQRRVVLVGKGLTFDSGGYNLKTAGSQIEMMKYDMGGSAAVLGAARALAELRPDGVEVHVVVAACENMISGGAVHPGDILTASNGKTIEINNTDAEGRLTLADALVYACKLEPDAVVDLATLTGACVIALGEEMAGLWSNCDGLADALLAAGQAEGEDLWRMPLRSSYKAGLKSQYADLKNTGPRPGGSITAALFLQDFVTPKLAWAHLDIAGTVWSDKGRGADPAGATGFGVRTLVHWICSGATFGAPA